MFFLRSLIATAKSPQNGESDYPEYGGARVIHVKEALGHVEWSDSV